MPDGTSGAPTRTSVRQAKANLTHHVVIHYSLPRSVWLTAEAPDCEHTRSGRRRTPSWKIRIAKFELRNFSLRTLRLCGESDQSL